MPRGEFQFIENLKSRYGLDKVGDDCAVLSIDVGTDLLATADLLIEDIDFKLEWTTPEMLGHKALAVSLSDIAAMGGTPKWAMLSIGAPENLWKTSFLDDFYTGWHRLASEHAVELVGGDVSRAPDKLVIDSIVTGEVTCDNAMLRSGARDGDAIFVTGYLGGAAAGLELLKQGRRTDEDLPTQIRHLLNRQLQPLPQVRTGKLLQESRLPTAAIDISDGLSSDLYHLVTMSNVGAKILAERIPVDPAIAGVTTLTSAAIDLALNGGEDFELLFTTRPERIPEALDLGFHHIGDITGDAGVVEIVTGAQIERLEPRGYRHF